MNNEDIIPVQSSTEMAAHWVRLGILDPRWLYIVERLEANGTS